MNNNFKSIISSDKNKEAINRAKKAVKQYKLALKSLEIQMAKNDIAIDKYENSDEYKNKLKDRLRELDKAS
ncbi:hypothetical protein [Clostridium sporogenes]|uniref:hypothetical protein n=1 Tax=Clostridium sporogenes TaxID=1509 RepID=UPI0013D5DB3D|nr:hypothetical protein [Clostridium sporogenes]NFH40760.1 hypothetical protein [Clostridium sporogenes]